jgi:catechol 2,3-dioxygenase-like lactoylglutathione lyase family enzyme
MHQTLTARAIDHLVLAVDDLDAAAAFYERLGFVVGSRNRHSWGTENRIVQLQGAFLELISIADAAAAPPPAGRAFSFGAFIAAYLARGPGLAMLALESNDARADAAAFAAAGIGDFEPFFFERQGRRPDGSETHVAFTLAFAQDGLAPQAGFFACQHHFPQDFWNPAFQAHPNGAIGIASVAMVAENPTDHHIFLSAFSGQRELASHSFGISVTLPRGRIDVLTPLAVGARFGPGVAGDSGPSRLIAFAVTVPDLARMQRRLSEAGIVPRLIGGRVVVAPGDAFGVAIAFESPAR